jgi:hypothetical protein
VLTVPAHDSLNRLAMWAWDARLQFGLAGLLLAIVGAVRLWQRSRPWAVFLALAYVTSTLFAFSYNVGDPHVFFLPSHLFTACAAGMALAPWPGKTGARLMAVVGVVVLIYAGWRGWDTWPAADRHQDYRGEALVARLTSGLDTERDLLVSGLNWETENALLYDARWEHRDYAWTRLGDVLPHFPRLVSDNAAIGRDVVLSSEAAADVAGAFGPLLPLVRDDFPPTPTLESVAQAIPRGAPYVLCVLTAPRDQRIDDIDLNNAVRVLTRRVLPQALSGRYAAFAGVAGEAPAWQRTSDRPFRASTAIAGEPWTIRMDSWMPYDAFRRGGFGHVVHGHQAVLTVERGVSLVWLDRDGKPQTYYAAGLYAPRPRFRLVGATAEVARTAQPSAAAQR